MTETHIHFANRCRTLRDGWPRGGWAARYGLNERAVQDLEQGRSLPSRALVLLLKAIELNPEWMRSVARLAKDDLALLDQSRGSRN